MKFFVCVFLALKLASAQQQQWSAEVDYNVAQQPHYQYPQPQYQYDNQQQAEDPVVGSALIDPFWKLKLAKPFIFGVPGLRFHNFNAGHLGPVHYGHSILGAANPNAEEDSQGIVPQAADYQLAAPQQQYSIDYYQQQYPAEQQAYAQDQYYQQAEPQVGAAPDQQDFIKIWHFANPQEQVGAPQQQYDQQQQYDYQQQQYQPELQQYQYQYQTPQYEQPIAAPQQYQADERSWGWNKGDDYGKKDYGKNDYKKIVYHKEIVKPVIKHDWNHGHSHGGCNKCGYQTHHYDHKPVDYYSKGYTKYYTKGYHQATPVYHQSYPTYSYTPSYSAPSFASPMVSAPIPEQQYINTDVEVAAPKSEVEKPPAPKAPTSEKPPAAAKPKTLKITTTHSPITTSSTTTTESTTEESTDEPNTTNTSAEKSDKKNTKTAGLLDFFKRSRRSISPYQPPNKRCIDFGNSLFYDTLLGAANPNVSDDVSARSEPDEDCDSDDCRPKIKPKLPPRRISITPEKAVAIIDRVSKPYLGMITEGNEKLWSNSGIVGRFIGPLEDTYLEFVQQNQQHVPQIHEAIRIIT